MVPFVIVLEEETNALVVPHSRTSRERTERATQA